MRTPSLFQYGALLVLVALGSTPSLLAAEAGTADRLAVRVAERLDRAQFADVDVTAQANTIRLVGSVETLRQREVAGRVAAKTDGVVAVDNALEVRWAEQDRDELLASVERALVDSRFNTIFDWVEANVESGLDGHRVTLTGWVTEGWKIESAEWKMSTLPGVTAVASRIEILPPSILDDEIRVAAARRLYGRNGFSQWAGALNPPVHMVVRHGEVILKGEVASRAEKMLARSLVGSTSIPFRIINQIQARSDLRS
jgi:osmotically-inducible protein OsmY